MAPVQDPPRPASASAAAQGAAPRPACPDTEQGVIEEARRRQRRRRAGSAVILGAVVLSLAIARLASGSAGGARHKAPPPMPLSAAPARPAARSAEPVRLAPALGAGELGWAMEVDFEAGDLGGLGGGCCFLLTHTAEAEMGGQWAGSHGWITVSVLTVPRVAAVSLEGRKVPTRSDGLPFGLRFAAVRVRYARTTSPVAFNARGQRIPIRGFTTLPKRHFFEGPYAPRRWRSPQAPPSGACELDANGLEGLSAARGGVVPEVKGYRVLDSRAFQSCADTYYSLGSSMLEAAILLDAEHPGSTPGALPDMTPVRGAAGVFEAPALRDAIAEAPAAPAQAGLTAERLSGAWLVVAGGASSTQRIQLLRHLRASIDLRR